MVIRNWIYRCFASRTFRLMFSVMLTFLLCACDKDEDKSSGQEGNYEGQAACWQTKIIEIVLSEVNNMFSTAAAKVAVDGWVVVMLGFAIWMAFRLLKILPSFKEENLGEIWTEIIQKLFLCAFCGWAASSVDLISWTLSTFVIPIYNTIIELGANILGQLSPNTTINLGEEMGTITFSGNYNQCSTSGLDASDLSGSIKPMAYCMTCMISDRLNGGIRVGVVLLSSLDLGAMFVGLSMMALYTFAKFAFVFFLVDSMFRLNFAAFLFPVLILGVPFSYTRKWSKHGFEMFLNSSGIMLFLGTLIAISVTSLEYILKTFADQDFFTETSLAGQGPIFLSLWLIAVLIINIPGLACTLADKFIGGGRGLEFQKQISQFAINTAKRAGAAILGSVTAGATKTITNTLEKYQGTREALDSMKAIKNKVNSKINSMAGYNDD